MKENRLDVLSINACRWADFRKSVTSTGEVIVYSGRKDNQHHKGEPIILSKTTAKTLVQYHPTNDRIIRVRLKTKSVQTSIIQVYAPTNDAEDEI